MYWWGQKDNYVRKLNTLFFKIVRMDVPKNTV